MCGIAGLIYKGKSSAIGQELTSMLQALKHRGPDSTGFALYGNPKADQYIMRFKVAEQEDVKKGFEIQKQMKERKATVDARMAEMGAKVEAHTAMCLALMVICGDWRITSKISRGPRSYRWVTRSN
jgi:glutamate synthase domain-containing protein 1